jgi:hypothetical protein
MVRRMSRLLIILGLVLLALGVIWPILEKIGLGKLPGDIIVRRDHVTFYFPIVTCIVLSVLLSLIVWLMNR